jgi:hypothetical protein
MYPIHHGWPDHSITPSIASNGPIPVFDFDIKVGGIVTVDLTSTGQGAIGLAFTKGKNWISEWSDPSDGGFNGPPYMGASPTLAIKHMRCQTSSSGVVLDT